MLSHWAKLAGLRGVGGDLALDPSRTGGAFSRHVDKVLGIDIHADFYMVDLPSFSGSEQARSEMSLAVTPLHEALVAEISDDPSMFEPLARMVKDDEFCENYTKDPIVASSAEPVLPVGLYLDGVQSQKKKIQRSASGG